MGTGILICGLNSCEKSTLGSALAEALHFHFIDNETLYFAGREPADPYSNPRTREQAAQILLEEIQAHPDYVYAAVKGDLGASFCCRYDYVVRIEIPKEVRLRRVRERSYQKFGNRMLPGGDLYRQEEAFFRMAESREEQAVEDWLRPLECPVIRVDGTSPPAENVAHILHAMK